VLETTDTVSHHPFQHSISVKLIPRRREIAIESWVYQEYNGPDGHDERADLEGGEEFE